MWAKYSSLCSLGYTDYAVADGNDENETGNDAEQADLPTFTVIDTFDTNFVVEDQVFLTTLEKDDSEDEFEVMVMTMMDTVDDPDDEEEEEQEEDTDDRNADEIDLHFSVTKPCWIDRPYTR